LIDCSEAVLSCLPGETEENDFSSERLERYDLMSETCA